ncbi:hypothetical protein BJX61DRAFT_133917 [Aspergillus egyptiacus]|nr:hypothetical protein BJX61DRAFT_133917 [Aspergillus egyptiacus]
MQALYLTFSCGGVQSAYFSLTVTIQYLILMPSLYPASESAAISCSVIMILHIKNSRTIDKDFLVHLTLDIPPFPTKSTFHVSRIILHFYGPSPIRQIVQYPQ